MNKRHSCLGGLVILGCLIAPLAAADGPPATDAEALARWQAMRFGMFVHWGPVSLKGTEIGWSRGRQVPVDEYDALYKRFNPTGFDADEWIRTAKAAGMKYFVITSKHHDGFCLWDTKTTDYKITNTPFGRDVLKELSQACRREGIQFSTYYSILDWHHPDYPTDSPGGKTPKPDADMVRYITYMKAQLREIVDGYGPLGVMWFDGEWEKPWTHEMGLDLYRYVRSLQPDILVNNRVDKGRRGMQGGTMGREYTGDFDTPEQRVGTFQTDRPWESCITICRQWAWKPNDRLKSLEECIHTLVYTAGGDGNLLLNVGPMPDGRIEPRQVERLKEIGRWLGRYGESIYATRGGPFKPGPGCASTHKGNRVYLHVLRWNAPPANGASLELPPLEAKVVKASVLGGGQAQVAQTPQGIVVTVAPAERKAPDTIVVLELDRPAAEIPPVAVVPQPLSLRRPAKASNVYQETARYGAGAAVDGDAHSRWATDAGTTSAWLEVDLGRPQEIGGVAIDECIEFGQRVKRFEVQVEAPSGGGQGWKTVLAGKQIGRHYRARFEPVTTRRVRLEILEATEGPTIWEFEVFGPTRK